MTDTTYTSPASPQPARKKKWLLPAVIVIVIIVAAGFFISQAGLDKALVKQKVDEYIAALKENGRAHGRLVEVTYSDLEVVGSFASKHVVVHNPSLSIKPLNEEPIVPGHEHKTDSLVITSPELVIYPTAMDLSALRISLPQPINFAGADAPEKSLLKVTSSTPIEAAIAQKTENGVPHVTFTHMPPASLDLNYLREQQANGAEDAAPTLVPVYDTLHMDIAAGSSVATDFASDGSSVGRGDIVYKQITMTPQSAPNAIITIAGIEAHWSNTLGDKKLNTVNMTVNIGPITAAPDVLPQAPINLALDVTFVGAMPATPNAMAASDVPDPTVTLKKLLLSTKDASFGAAANFTASPSDILPVGTATLTFTNMPFIHEQLQKRGILNADNEGWIGGVIEQITGTPFDQLKDVEVPIERTHGGAFKIGKSTFEELFAVVLKHMLKPGSAPMPAPSAAPSTTPSPQPGAMLAPQLPAADKPKAPPIPVPDNGVRG